MIKIDHAALYAQDLEAMRDFFVTYFNGKAGEMYHNKKTNFRSYFITFEDGSRIEVMTRLEVTPKCSEEYPAGYHHLSFNVGNREIVDSMSNKLSEDGYTVL